jgi:hypothetical protein
MAPCPSTPGWALRAAAAGRPAPTDEEEDPMECRKEETLETCTCTYDPCPRKGLCCECVAYHLRSRQLPGCFFPKAAEKTYDRSFEHFAKLVASGRA